MKRYMLLQVSAFLLLAISGCLAEADDSFETKAEISQGLRSDHLKWTVSGKHETRDARIKYDVRDSKVYLSGLKASVSKGPYIGVISALYGNVFSGKVRNRTYDEKNKNEELAHLHAKIKDDYTLDCSAKIGRMCNVFSDAFITPSIGYGMFLQRYKMKHGHLTTQGKHPDYPGAPQFHDVREKIHGLDASSKARWLSPFIEVRFCKPLIYNIKLDLGYTFFYPMYYTNKTHAEHVRTKDKSRERNTYGHYGDIALRWCFIEHVELSLGCATMQFRGSKGSTRVWGHGVSHDTFDFKKVRRTTTDYLLALSYSF